MKYLVILLLLIGITGFAGFLPTASALCLIGTDWPDEPCYGRSGDWPGIEQEKLDWMPYYDYKGAEWMESKKQEMTQALQNGTLSEWIKLTRDTHAHDNVHRYYFLLGEVPNLDGKFVDEVFAQEKIIPPPLKQMKLGIKLGHIICDEDKNQTWNVHFKPACIFPDSESKLLTRGWAKLRLILPASSDPIKELKWTGQNEVTYRILGNIRIGDEPPPSTLDEKRKIVWEYAQKYHPGERFLEYSIPTSGMYHYNIGDKIQFDLLEWGNYSECWNLKLRIIDIHNQPVYEDNSVRFCLEPLTDGQLGWFSSYSMGKEFDEFVCNKVGYYRIEVSNGEIFPPTILQNFACLNAESEIEPSTRIEISFGNVTEKKLLPVVISEITTNAKSLDAIKVWGFELIGHSGDDRGKVWEIIPKEQRIWYEITDEHGQDVIDKTRMPENFAIPSNQLIYQMDCGLFRIVEGESADHTTFPINERTTTIIAKNTDKGIYPNSKGEYSFEFASIFETTVKLPENAEIISQESKHCKLTQNIEDDPEGKYTDGYYTKMVFRLD